jgi:hypothetical protein
LAREELAKKRGAQRPTLEEKRYPGGSHGNNEKLSNEAESLDGSGAAAHKLPSLGTFAPFCTLTPPLQSGHLPPTLKVPSEGAMAPAVTCCEVIAEHCEAVGAPPRLPAAQEETLQDRGQSNDTIVFGGKRWSTVDISKAQPSGRSCAHVIHAAATLLLGSSWHLCATAIVPTEMIVAISSRITRNYGKYTDDRRGAGDVYFI